ncbi:MAG: SDR family oxidoreductase [Oligoflexia bacterium]|nr:SDR family oxidoreductase [Oligoflexia bacterium]MBF0366300.1 SDR family oxidoreductase [Oligoflexia bacterium]
MNLSLKARKAIITGANQGLGLEIAKEFLKAGADVALCARDEMRLNAVKESLSTLFPNQAIITCKVDVASEEEVKNFISQAIFKLGRVDIIVNNAGIYGPMGLLEEVSVKEWVQAIEINLYSVLYTLKYLLPHMKQNRYGKVINLSGGGATNPLPRISAYAASKAALVRLTETLACECKDDGIDINAIAPGALNTRLLDEVLEKGAESVGKVFYEKALKQKAEGGAPMDRAAELCVYLASAESDGISGKLISALWDQWPRFQEFKEELLSSDIYTLRRIVAEDRGKQWSL